MSDIDMYVTDSGGHDPSYVSLYLSAEPTLEERERGVAGSTTSIHASNSTWTRDGLYKFCFEVRLGVMGLARARLLRTALTGQELGQDDCL